MKGLGGVSWPWGGGGGWLTLKREKGIWGKYFTPFFFNVTREEGRLIGLVWCALSRMSACLPLPAPASVLMPRRNTLTDHLEMCRGNTCRPTPGIISQPGMEQCVLLYLFLFLNSIF